MRTQEEIYNMMRQIDKTGADPHEAMHKALLRKLEWGNALRWINPKYRGNRIVKKEWKSNARLDFETLETELKDLVDEALMHWYEKDTFAVLYMLQQIQAHLWLMGEKKTKVLEHFIKKLFETFESDTMENAYLCLKLVIQESGWELKEFERRYLTDENKNNLTDNYGKDFS